MADQPAKKTADERQELDQYIEEYASKVESIYKEVNEQTMNAEESDAAEETSNSPQVESSSKENDGGVAVAPSDTESAETPKNTESVGDSHDKSDSGSKGKDGDHATTPDVTTGMSSDTDDVQPAKEENDDNADDSFEVAALRKTWKQKAETTATTKRSQLLNLNDFHMQQRQERVGDKLKKRESAENLHSFRNHDHKPSTTKQQSDNIKQPPPEQTKAADRAAMAQYMFLRQSRSKDEKPKSSTAPHRTLSLKNPTAPDALTPSKSGDSSSSSSTSMSATATTKWRKSPTSGKSVIVTDVDEFYAQQHAIHLEDQRKKREILHISDNKDIVAPDKSSTLPSPNYVKSIIPSLVDSVSEEDDSLAVAPSLSTDSEGGKAGGAPRNLSEEFGKASVDDDVETLKEGGVAGSDEVVHVTKDDENGEDSGDAVIVENSPASKLSQEVEVPKEDVNKDGGATTEVNNGSTPESVTIASKKEDEDVAKEAAIVTADPSTICDSEPAAEEVGAEVETKKEDSADASEQEVEESNDDKKNTADDTATTVDVSPEETATKPADDAEVTVTSVPRETKMSIDDQEGIMDQDDEAKSAPTTVLPSEDSGAMQSAAAVETEPENDNSLKSPSETSAGEEPREHVFSRNTELALYQSEDDEKAVANECEAEDDRTSSLVEEGVTEDNDDVGKDSSNEVMEIAESNPATISTNPSQEKPQSLPASTENSVVLPSGDGDLAAGERCNDEVVASVPREMVKQADEDDGETSVGAAKEDAASDGNDDAAQGNEPLITESHDNEQQDDPVEQAAVQSGGDANPEATTDDVLHEEDQNDDFVLVEAEDAAIEEAVVEEVLSPIGPSDREEGNLPPTSGAVEIAMEKTVVEAGEEQGANEIPEEQSEKPASEVIDHVPDDISRVPSSEDDSTASVDGDLTTDQRSELATIEGSLDVEKKSASELIDHVPDDISDAASSSKGDSTASIDGDPNFELESGLTTEEDIVVMVEDSSEKPASELVDHVPDDISEANTSSKGDSTATVDGDLDGEAEDELVTREGAFEDQVEPALDGSDEELASPAGDVLVPGAALVEVAKTDVAISLERIASEEAATQTVIDEPTSELIDHVPDDISEAANSSKGDSTASVDGDLLGEADDDLVTGVGAIEDSDELLLDKNISGCDGESASFVAAIVQELVSVEAGESRGVVTEAFVTQTSTDKSASELLDHVPDDISEAVSSSKGDSTASVDGDVSGAAYDELMSEILDLSKPALGENDRELLDHVPSTISSVPTKDDDSTASVDGDLADIATENNIQPRSSVSSKKEDEPWDERKDELMPSSPNRSKDIVAEPKIAVSESVSDDKTDADADSDGVVLEELLSSREEAEGEPSVPGATEEDEVGVVSPPDETLGVEHDEPKTTSVEEKSGDESVPHDESILDELLASRDDTDDQQEIVPEHEDGPPKEASLKTEAAVEEVVAGAVGAEMLASRGDISDGEGPSDEDKEPGNTTMLMSDLAADESMLKVFEETDADTSGFDSEYNKVDKVPPQESDLHDVSAIYAASSKDTTDDVSHSEVIADFIRSGTMSEDKEDFVPPEAPSVVSSATGTESSDDSKPDLTGCAPSAGSTDKPAAASPGAKVEVDYKSADYRGFVFVVHKSYGLMLLYCTRKKKKGPHYQLPGGHVDEPEFFAAAEESRDAQNQLLLASRAGAARELYEETGMDVRFQLDRLEPAALRNDVELDKHGKPILKNELKHRLYFFLAVTDDDFWSSEKGDSEFGRMHPLGAAKGCDGSHLMLKLSHEHQGWTFEKDPSKSAQMLAVHSGGNGAIALRMSMAREGALKEDDEGKKPPADEKPAAAEQTNKELQSETWETEPLVKDEAAAAADSQQVARSAPDLMPPPEASGLAKLFGCCLWFQSKDD